MRLVYRAAHENGDGKRRDSDKFALAGAFRCLEHRWKADIVFSSYIFDV